jgi:TIGR03009 family protein
MSLRLHGFALLGLVVAAVSALAQTYPAGGAYPPGNGNPNGVPNNTAAAPDQPIQPRTPELVPRNGATQPSVQQPPEPPVTLTPQEEAARDQVLLMWENRNKDIKKFDAKFKRWTYDAVFGKPGVPKFVDLGSVIYAAPDQGLYAVDFTEEKNVLKAIGDDRAEKWICDGRAVFEYNYKTRKVIEHKLPPDQQGKAIANSPLPFLFGSEAKALKQRYFIRLVTPPNVQDQYWLEAYPRFQQDAANFSSAQFIINKKDMTPFALKMVEPNKTNSVVYQFYDVGVNIPPGLFGGNPLRPSLPFGWQKTVDDSQLSRAPRSTSGVQR